MDYRIGNLGRVILAQGGEGEDLYAQIESIAAREKIACAVVLVVGGLRHGKVVVGPKSPTGPISPQWSEFNDAREIVGVGTIISDNGLPKLHLHAGIGRGKEAIVGCPRGGATVFCTLEVTILEILGIQAGRELDPELGLKLLKLL